MNREDVDQEAMIEKMKEMGAVEETIVIPVGIQMLINETEEKNSEIIEASLVDVKTDKMIQIWLDESVEDRSIASFVFLTK
jgi:imidazoleglycerol phosphate synthase glutamine amidotransferase subunit HisH